MSGGVASQSLSGILGMRVSGPVRRHPRLAADAGSATWQTAGALLLVVLLFRPELATFAAWLPSDSSAAAVPGPVATGAPAPPGSAPAEPARPAASEAPALAAPAVSAPASPVPAFPTPAQPPPLPVVITPSLETSRNVAIARRDRNGRYTVDTAVNGVAVSMLFDTGATLVVLCAADAARIGFDVDALDFSHVARTANGTASVALVTIPTLTVGTITRRDVAALVARPGRLEVSLLGQSFLTRVANYTMEGDRLIIRGGEWREGR